MTHVPADTSSSGTQLPDAAQLPDASPPAAQSTDGRRARRERGRVAVLDATIDLVLGGDAPASADQIADNAGVSVATLFRYFNTLDQLRSQTTERYFERFADLFEIPGVGVGSIDERIEQFVTTRLHIYNITAPMARFARKRAYDIDAVADVVHLLRLTRADQVRFHFANEIEARSRASADDLVALISTATSFEAWEQMVQDHSRSEAQIRRAWKHALAQFLSN